MKVTARKAPTGRLTASRLRADVYRVLDRVIQTGVPAEIVRRGKVLRIVPAEQVERLERLPARPDFIKGDPEELVHLDWSHEWRP
jgi:antitoxin (DNA-binding transcriptional repressor) of toxin-antitoxin stability system